MCSACRLIVLYSCVKFRENISNGFQLTRRTRVDGRNGYVRCSNSNNSNCRQTRVLVHVFCSSSYIMLYVCVKAVENISDDIRVMERGHERCKR